MDPQSVTHNGPPGNALPEKGLPPVVPLTGRFIGQLFLVPMIIVVVLVAILLGFSWLAGGPRTPKDYLDHLRSSNAEFRWRAAEDLAQTLLRDDQLASDPRFALDLTGRVHQSLANVRSLEQGMADRLRDPARGVTEAEQKAWQEEQNNLFYLSACLGNLTIPVGAPILSELATLTEGGEERAVTRRRWRALWALSNLGESCKRFDRLPAERQAAVVAILEEEAAGQDPDRSGWARAALQYLGGPSKAGPRRLQPLGVEKALVQCAADANAHLRAHVALALSFWEGDTDESARLEGVLLRLARDDGRGEELVAEFFNQENEPANVISKVPGLAIRYQATLALARRGSGKVSLEMLQDMLDPDGLRQNFRRIKGGQEVPAEAAAAQMLVGACRAIARLHEKAPGLDLSPLIPALERLEADGQTAAAIRTEAKSAREQLQAK